MARTKYVHRPDMVAHLWAHQAQDAARDPGHRLYFQGDTIYSYGSHFPIARHVTNRKGDKAILFTTRSYSVTTSGHMSQVSSAIRDQKPVFYVSDPTSTSRSEGFSDYADRFQALTKAYAKARGRKPTIFRKIEELVEQANQYAKFFGLRSRLKMPADAEALQAECAAIERRNADKVRRLKAKQRRLDEDRLKELGKRLAKWVKGVGDYDYRFSELDVKMRIVGDELQTSLGASCPLEHAKKAFKLLAALRSKGKTYQANGHTIHVGNFQIDSMDADGTVKAGCHTIAWEEIERVAKLAGVL